VITTYRVKADFGNYDYEYDVEIDYLKAYPSIDRLVQIDSSEYASQFPEDNKGIEAFLKLLLRKLMYMSMAVPEHEVLEQIMQEEFWFPVHDGSKGVKVTYFDNWKDKPFDADILIEKLETKSEE